MRAGLLLPIFFTLLLARGAFAHSAVYKLNGFAQNIDLCNVAKPQVIAKLQATAGIQILSSTCSETARHEADLVVEYLATPNDLPLVSTYSEFAVVNGLYASRADCEAAIPSESGAFEANTGLRPVVAYCFRDLDQRDNARPWVMRVDSFGRAQKSPFNVSSHVFGRTSQSTATMESALRTHLSTLGGSAVKTSITSNGFDTFLIATYYAEAALPIVRYDFGKATTLDSCTQTKSRFEDIVNKASGSVPVFLCTVGQLTRGIEMFALATASKKLASETSGLVFSTIAACEDERKATEEKYRIVLHRNIVGSICSWDHFIDSDAVWMRLFWLE